MMSACEMCGLVDYDHETFKCPAADGPFKVGNRVRQIGGYQEFRGMTGTVAHVYPDNTPWGYIGVQLDDNPIVKSEIQCYPSELESEDIQ